MKNHKKTAFADFKLKLTYILLVAMVLLAPAKIIHASEDLLPADPEAGVSDTLSTDPNDEQATDPNSDQITDPNDGQVTGPNDEQATDPNDDQITDPNDGQITDPNDEQATDPNDEQGTNSNDGQTGLPAIIPDGLTPCAYGGILPSPKSLIMALSLDLLGYSYDLSDFVHQVMVNEGSNVLYDSDNPGAYTPPISVQTGKNYMITMRFEEVPGGRQFKYNSSGWLVYTLPAGLNFTAMSGVITGDDNAAIGQYQISGNILQAKFGNVRTDGTPTPNGSNFIDYYANCYFVVMAQAQLVYADDGTLETIDFFGNLTIDVVIAPPPVVNGDMTISKSMPQNIDPAAHTAASTITIGATGGPITLTSLDDQIQFNDGGLKIGDIDITAAGYPVVKLNNSTIPSSNYTISGLTLNGVTNNYDIDNLNPTTDHFTITFATPVTLNPGDTLTVTYTPHIKDSYAQIKTITGPFGPNKNVLWNNARLSNTVIATGNRKSDSGPLTKTATASSTLYAQVVMKSAAKSSTTSTPDNITWTINIGDGYTALNDQTITDWLSGNAAYQSPFTVTLYDASRTVIGSATTYTPGMDNAGTANAGSITWSSTFTSPFNSTTNLNSFTYTVPTNPGPGKSVKYITIRYDSTQDTTSAAVSPFTTKNDVDITYPNGMGTGNAETSYTPSTTVTVDLMAMSKSGELKADASGGYILYTVKVAVPKAAYNQNVALLEYNGVTVRDADNNATYIVKYFNFSSSTSDIASLNAYAAQNMTVKVYSLDSGQFASLPNSTSDAKIAAFDPVTSGCPEVDQSIFNTSSPFSGSWYLSYLYASSCRWQMNFGAPGTISSTSKTSVWPVDGDSLLVVTYKVPLSSALLTSSYPNTAIGKTLGQALTNSASTPNSYLPGYSAASSTTTSLSHVDNTVVVRYNGADGSYWRAKYMLATINKLTGSHPKAIFPSDIASKSNSADYWTGSNPGEIYFPYDVEIRYPYKTVLDAPPVFTDAFDPTLKYAGTDTEDFCYVALHYEDIRIGSKSYDMLITVPKNVIDEWSDGVNGHISIDFAKLSDAKAKVFQRTDLGGNDRSANVSYSGTPVSASLAGTTVTSCWNYICGQLASYPPTGNWYDQNCEATGSNVQNFTSNVWATYSVYYVLTFATPNLYPPVSTDGLIHLKNTATQKIRLIDGGSLDLKANAEITINPLKKTMTQVGNTDTAKVVITVNPAAMTLAGGPGTVYVMHDTMTNLSLYLDTLKLYTFPGGVKTEATLTPASGTPPAAGTDGDPLGQTPFTYFVSADGKEIWFFLPDNTSMELDYTTKIIGSSGVSVSNEVKISGTYRTSASGSMTISSSNAQGGGSLGSLYLIKQAEVGHARLPGATFALYGPLSPPGWNGEDENWLAANVPPGVAPMITVGDSLTPNYYFLDMQTTGVGGITKFESNVLLPVSSGNTNLYALKEINSPSGFNKLTDPILFTFNNNIAAPSSLPSGVAAGSWQVIPANILTASDSVNENTTNATINVAKTIENAHPGFWIPGTEAMPVTDFAIEQVDGLDGNPVPGGYTDRYTMMGLSISQTTNKNFTFTIPGLSSGETYYYKITEAQIGDDDGHHWTYDSTSYIVEVEVSSGASPTATVTYYHNSPDALDTYTQIVDTKASFTNVYSASVSALLVNCTKTVQGDDIPDGSHMFTYNLEQVDENWETIEDPYTASVQHDGPGDFQFDLTDFATQPGTYYFKITEQDDSEPGWTYDTTVYFVEVNVTGPPLVVTVTVYNVVDGSPTTPVMDNIASFCNSYTPTGPILPETGGSGTSPYTLAGAGLMFLSGILMFREKMRRVPRNCRGI